jgi:NAD(P)-dependent dehydrogenase (short-subunit alcohol dehydrogenase family)
VFYDLAKVAVIRLAFSQGHELARHGATAVAITPGWPRSEMMLDNYGVSEANWRDALDPGRAAHGQPVAPDGFALSESPRYVGGAIVAWHRIPTAPAGTRSRSAPVKSRASTGSPTSTARDPTAGVISRRSATAVSRQTSTTIGNSTPDRSGTT